MNDTFYGDDMEPGLRRGNYAIEWENLGEGRCGEYDAEDPNDVNFLRFSVYMIDPTKDSSLDFWDTKEAVDDACYCTEIPASTDPAILKKLLVRMMNEIYSEGYGVGNHPYLKRICEQLSWITVDAVA